MGVDLGTNGPAKPLELVGHEELLLKLFFRIATEVFPSQLLLAKIALARNGLPGTLGLLIEHTLHVLIDEAIEFAG